MRTLNRQRGLGILYILGAALMFALMNLFVRLAGDLPVMQKVFFRNLIAAVIVFFMLCFDKQKFKIKSRECLLWLFLRSLLGFIGVILNFYAIDRLNISDASILNKLSPFFAIVFSLLVLKEKPKLVEVAFVLVAFIGALFVIKPTFGVETLPSAAGFLSGACAGFAYTCVRVLGLKGERGLMTVFFFSVFSTVVALPFMIAFYQPMSWAQTTFLLLAGLSATGGQFFITAAYRKAPAKEIAVFDYAQVLFAALLGFFFLEQLPDLWSIIGYIVIIGAAIAKWLYHLKKHAQRHTDAPSPDTENQPTPQESDENQNITK